MTSVQSPARALSSLSTITTRAAAGIETASARLGENVWSGAPGGVPKMSMYARRTVRRPSSRMSMRRS